MSYDYEEILEPTEPTFAYLQQKSPEKKWISSNIDSSYELNKIIFQATTNIWNLSRKYPQPEIFFDTFVDRHGIIRANGLLAQSPALTYNKRYLILLPCNSKLSQLLVEFTHKITLNRKNQLMIRVLRTEYSTFRLKSLVKSVIQTVKLVFCTKNRHKKVHLHICMLIHKSCISWSSKWFIVPSRIFPLNKKTLMSRSHLIRQWEKFRRSSRTTQKRPSRIHTSQSSDPSFQSPKS